MKQHCLSEQVHDSVDFQQGDEVLLTRVFMVIMGTTPNDNRQQSVVKDFNVVVKNPSDKVFQEISRFVPFMLCQQGHEGTKRTLKWLS